MSSNSNYESKAKISTIKATSRASIKVFSAYAHKAPNGKLYFGITSLNPAHRWYSDGSGYRNQPLFYRAIQKYGWNNFEHFIIATNLSKEQACRLERDLIFMFNSNNPKYGYNNTDGGEGINGYKHTEQAKKKISKHSIKTKSYLNFLKNKVDRRKGCALVDKKGKIIYRYNSLTECAKALDMSISGVSVNVKYHRKYGQLKFIEL